MLVFLKTHSLIHGHKHTLGAFKWFPEQLLLSSNEAVLQVPFGNEDPTMKLKTKNPFSENTHKIR